MTDQLELFEPITKSSCKYPYLKKSSAYQYGCRCNECVQNNRQYNKRYLKEKRGLSQCELCSKEMSGLRVYPVCHECVTSFMIRMRQIAAPWAQVLAWHQRASCGICGCQFHMDRAGGPGSWQVDHDHTKGEKISRHNYRDVLCGPCNSGIGALEANIRRGLITEIKGPFGDYLARHQSTPPTSDT
jgi:hypothetical protein